MFFLQIIKKLIPLLDEVFKKKVIKLLIAYIFIIFLEMFSVGSLVPLIVIFTDINLFLENELSRELYFFLGSPDQTQLLKYSLIFIFFIFLIKTIFIFLWQFSISKLSQDFNVYLSSNMLDKYMKLNLKNLKDINIAEIARDVTREVDVVSNYCFKITIPLVCEAMLIILVFLSFFYINFTATLTIFVLLITSALLYVKIVSKSIVALSSEIQVSQLKQIQTTNEIFNNIKIIKLYSKYSDQLMQFVGYAKTMASAKFKNEILKNLPRLLFEFLSVSVCIFLILILLIQGKSVNTIFITLGLFAVVIFKLFPMTIKIIDYIQILKFLIPSLNIIENKTNSLKNIKNKAKNYEDQKISFESLQNISINKISFSYNEDKELFNKLDFHIKKNECVGIIGASGTGKSTLIDLIMGFYEPSNGNILINGININRYDKSWKNKIGYVPQHSYLFDSSIAQNIAFTYNKETIDYLKINEVIKLAQLKNFVDNLPNKIHENIGENGAKLSSGQKQRIAIARCLYFQPKLIILDEATSNLDIDNEDNFFKSIENILNQNTTIIISHRKNSLKSCSKIFELKNNQLIQVK